jgi:hypothetical protein
MLVLERRTAVGHSLLMTLKEAQAMLKQKQAKIAQLEKELAEARRRQAFDEGTKIRIIGPCEIVSGPDSGEYEVNVCGNDNSIYLSREEFEVIK